MDAEGRPSFGRTPMDADGRRWTPMDADGRRWTPMDADGRRMTPNDADGRRWTPMDADGRRWTPMDADGRRLTPMDADGRRWTPMDADGRRWTPMDADGRRWTPKHVTHQVQHALNLGANCPADHHAAGDVQISVLQKIRHNLGFGDPLESRTEMIISSLRMGCLPSTNGGKQPPSFRKHELPSDRRSSLYVRRLTASFRTQLVFQRPTHSVAAPDVLKTRASWKEASSTWCSKLCFAPEVKLHER